MLSIDPSIKLPKSPKLPKLPSARRRSYLPPYRDALPSPEVCAIVNQQIHSNPALGECSNATFDFAAHVQSRSYLVRSLVFPSTSTSPNSTDTCSALLDAGVTALLPHTFEPLPTFPAHDPLFTIGPAGRTGLGMFATRAIPAWTLVLAERPAVLLPYVIGLTTPLAEIARVLFDRLPSTTRAAVTALADSWAGKEVGTLCEGIVRTNAIGVDLEVPDMPHPELRTHRAVFLNTSRCNHSCSPNAKWEWDLASFSLFLIAVRPISPGEEITIHYTAPDRSRGERQVALRAQFNFDCLCPCCVKESSLDALCESDCARTALSQILSDLPVCFEQWCIDRSLPDDALISLHLRALHLIKQEGLQALGMEKHVDALAMCYGALGDVEKFRKWVGRVKEMRMGRTPDQALVFARWLSNPLCFPAWEWRKTFCGRRGEEDR